MRTVATAAANLFAPGRRLDASYHASSGVRAQLHIERWAASGMLNARRLDLLGDVADLFNGPRFPRVYVTDPGRSVPFLSSSDMLQADLRAVKRLSLKMTSPTLLKAICLEQGWTLISCSGTVGNTVYVRSDMHGMTGSQHIMRVAPHSSEIPSGYLYTFLSSKIGYNLVTMGMYGALIQHIEPQHIENLPIPRLDPTVEQRIHDLIEQAARLRVEAREDLLGIQQQLHHWLGINDPLLPPYEHARSWDAVSFSRASNRLDAFFYIGYVGEALRHESLRNHPSKPPECVKPFWTRN